MQRQEDSLQLWQKKYKKQKNIIYEICNEPNGCDWKTVKRYASQVIKVIRKYDKKAIIVVGTPTWSQLGSDGTHNEVADNPIKGYKNIMYSLHFYANEWSHNRYLPAKLAYARKKGIAVIVTEFGMSGGKRRWRHKQSLHRQMADQTQQGECQLFLLESQQQE